MSQEKESAARLRKGELKRAVLGTIAAAGIVTVAVAAPNVVRLLERVNPEWIAGTDPRQRIHVTVSKLKRKGLIEFIDRDGKKKMQLTAKGRKEIASIMSGHMTIPRPRKWDRRWRVIIFDIPERRAGDRQKVRRLLTGLGFEKLQHSVWAHPFPCEEIIVLLKTEMKLGRHLLYIIADAIEYDTPIKERFDLK